MTPTNWPNPERPGYPMFPDRDGVHVIKWGNNPALKWDNNPASTCGFEIWEWDRAAQKWNGIEPKGMINEGYSYISPLLTPNQLAELRAAERDRCADVCGGIMSQAHLNALECGHSEEGHEIYLRDKGIYGGADECCKAIRNLGGTP